MHVAARKVYQKHYLWKVSRHRTFWNRDSSKGSGNSRGRRGVGQRRGGETGEAWGLLSSENYTCQKSIQSIPKLLLTSATDYYNNINIHGGWCGTHTGEVKTEESGCKQPGLHNKLEASLGYMEHPSQEAKQQQTDDDNDDDNVY